jgi:hypothetical protein
VSSLHWLQSLIPILFRSILLRYYLAVLLIVLILSHEPRDSIRIGLLHIGGQEGERCPATCLRVIGGLKQAETSTIIKIVVQGDVGRKIGTRVQRARSLSAIQGGHEGMLVHPVRAREWTFEAGSDTIAGGVNAVFRIEVDFGDDASHVNALEV